jgi:hypothetical protein
MIRDASLNRWGAAQPRTFARARASRRGSVASDESEEAAAAAAASGATSARASRRSGERSNLGGRACGRSLWCYERSNTRDSKSEVEAEAETEDPNPDGARSPRRVGRARSVRRASAARRRPRPARSARPRVDRVGRVAPRAAGEALRRPVRDTGRSTQDAPARPGRRALSDPRGIRTLVTSVKGRCPRPG